MVDHPLPVVYCQVGFGEELRSDVEGLILYLGASAQDYEYYETPCIHDYYATPCNHLPTSHVSRLQWHTGLAGLDTTCLTIGDIIQITRTRHQQTADMHSNTLNNIHVMNMVDFPSALSVDLTFQSY